MAIAEQPISSPAVAHTATPEHSPPVESDLAALLSRSASKAPSVNGTVNGLGTAPTYPPTPTMTSVEASPAGLASDSAPSSKPLRWRETHTVQFSDGQAQAGVLRLEGQPSSRPTQRASPRPPSVQASPYHSQHPQGQSAVPTPPAPAPAQSTPAAHAKAQPSPAPHVAAARTQAFRTAAAAPPPTRQPQHVQRQPRPMIMDPPESRRQSHPPAAASPQGSGQVSGIPSPSRDYVSENPKFVDDCTRITHAFRQSLPEAVRRTVRDNWEKCLLGSDFHQAFVLNAAIHHSTPSTTRRAVHDFGAKMVGDCRDEIARLFTQADLDAVAGILINNASDAFLDMCLSKRLPTIEAKTLINALARAERLGYDENDIVDDNVHEQPMSHPVAPIPPTTPAHASAPRPALPAHPPQQRMQCMECFRTFRYASAYHHHTSKRVCSRVPPSIDGFKFACEHCGQGFTQSAGQQYHKANNVCGDLKEMQSGQPSQAVAQSATKMPKQGRPRAPPAAISPSTPGSQNGEVQLTPSSHKALAKQAVAAAAATAAGSLGIQADPYGHLTAEQLAAMNAELGAAEMHYAGRFKEAEAIENPAERRSRVDGLRNSFGTKQSMIRKKFGVRLRERRTRAAIEAERQRMGMGISRPAAAAIENGAAATHDGALLAQQAVEGLRAFSHTLSPTPPVSAAVTVPEASTWATTIAKKRSPPEINEPEAKRQRMEEPLKSPHPDTMQVVVTDTPVLSPSEAAAQSPLVDGALPLNDEPAVINVDSSENDDDDDDDGDISAALPPSIQNSLSQTSLSRPQ